MKQILLSILAVCMISILPSQAQSVDGRNFSIDGFAAYAGTPGTSHYLAGGTTGGHGVDSAVHHDLMGRRVFTPQKGQIYVKDGKKFIKK